MYNPGCLVKSWYTLGLEMGSTAKLFPERRIVVSRNCVSLELSRQAGVGDAKGNG